MLADMRKRHGEDKTIQLDLANASFACKVPIYEFDHMGRPVVRKWDCVQRRTVTYSQQEWERKQTMGEV